ncbi:MAG: CDP-archaeol synthase, partial [Methyloceanibacter sp.]
MVLLAVANGTPVIAKKILGDAFGSPLDGGALLADGRPLFGSSKTLRGIVLAAGGHGLRGAARPWLEAVAMAGDLFSS